MENSGLGVKGDGPAGGHLHVQVWRRQVYVVNLECCPVGRDLDGERRFPVHPVPEVGGEVVMEMLHDQHRRTETPQATEQSRQGLGSSCRGGDADDRHRQRMRPRPCTPSDVPDHLDLADHPHPVHELALVLRGGRLRQHLDGAGA